MMAGGALRGGRRWLELSLVAADALPVPPPASVLLLLLLAQPATAIEPTAATARTRRPFIGYASIPGYLTM